MVKLADCKDQTGNFAVLIIMANFKEKKNYRLKNNEEGRKMHYSKELLMSIVHSYMLLSAQRTQLKKLRASLLFSPFEIQ